jgi:diguanylate cyclase (GGDEF)-like protein
MLSSAVERDTPRSAATSTAPPAVSQGAEAHTTRAARGIQITTGARLTLATLSCVAIFLLDRTTTTSTMATQLYPAALLPLYGMSARYVVGAFWLAIVGLIVANVPAFDLAELDAGRLLSVAMVSLAAIAMIRLSGHERRLRREALIDPLTGVFNRRSFLEFSSKEEARTRRGGKTFAVLMVDIDHFKRINDTYGHPAGDVVIKELADVATRVLRPSDVLARYGGEEFVINLPDTTQDQALVVAERLRRAVEASAVVSDAGAIRFTVSVGVATCSHRTPLSEAIAHADKALYAAKQNGRNRVELSLAAALPERSSPAATDESSAEADVEGKRILLVDDEDEIRGLLADWLKDSGYTVLTAGNAADALRIVETDPALALLFTDIVMPGELDGFDLGWRAQAMRPDLKILYMSGYVRPEATDPTRGASVHLLPKPFRLSHVLESVGRALSS